MSDYNINSILALGTIPAEDADGRMALKQAIELWVCSLETAKWPRAVQWFENSSYLLGNHSSHFYYDAMQGFGVADTNWSSANSDQVSVPPTTENRLPRAVESFVGLLTEIDPTPRVAPNSDRPEDEDAAALSEIVFDEVSERPLNLRNQLEDAASTAAIFDMVFAETEYAETNERIEVPRIKMVKQRNNLYDPEDPAMGPEEVEVPTPDGYDYTNRRDITLRIWTPLHITTDPGATKPEDLTWIARSTFEDVDYIKSKFAQDDEERTEENGYFLPKGEPLTINNGANHPLYWYTRVQDILTSPQYGIGGGMASNLLTHAGALPNQTLFTVIDVAPTDDFPKGRTLVYAGGQLIYAGQARAWTPEYPWRWHPYSFYTWMKVKGRFTGMALLSELLPLQKRINAIDYLVQCNREYMAIGQWWLPKHAKVKMGMVGGMPGQQYEFTDMPGMAKPERVKNDPLPPDLWNERGQLVGAIDTISSIGVRDDQISASAARAGVMLDFMRAEKLRNKGPSLHGFETFIEGIAQNVLIEIQRNLKINDPELTARLRRAARDFSSLSLETFTGASLRDHHAVKIDIASALRHAPEALAQRAVEAFQFSQGQVTPGERAGFFKAMGLDKFVKNPTNASVQRARRMISRITMGMTQAFLALPPGIEDHGAMALEFQVACLSDKFIEYDAEIQTALLDAQAFYATEAAKAAQAAMEQELLLKGLHPSQMAAQQTPEVTPQATAAEKAPAGQQ